MRWLATSFALAALACSPGVLAHQNDAAPDASIPSHTHEGGIRPAPDPAVLAPFDIVHAKITTQGNVATFHMAVSGHAGSSLPTPNGKFEGASVFSYVWPTTIDTWEVGFDHDAGILALAVTSHPDFDDTPLFDENGNGSLGDDGGVWHSHWVVLGPDDTCGPGALKVMDIPPETKPRLPKTWPGVPLLLDSPGWQPSVASDTVAVRIPFDDIDSVKGASFDGVTAGLRINASAHAPLLCVTDVFKVASGDLSLPGKPDQ